MGRQFQSDFPSPPGVKRILDASWHSGNNDTPEQASVTLIPWGVWGYAFGFPVPHVPFTVKNVMQK